MDRLNKSPNPRDTFSPLRLASHEVYRSGGFTLLEVMFSVAILSLVLAASSAMVVSQQAALSNTLQRQTRDDTYFRLARIAGFPSNFKASFQSANFTTPINPCLLTCLNGVSSTNACGTNPKCTTAVGGPVNWYSLTLYDPQSGLAIAGVDPTNPAVPIRYMSSGVLCPSTLPDSVCPLSTKVSFNPICKNLASSCVIAEQLQVRMDFSRSAGATQGSTLTRHLKATLAANRIVAPSAVMTGYPIQTGATVGAGPGYDLLHRGDDDDRDGNHCGVGDTTVSGGALGRQIGAHGSWDCAVEKDDPNGNYLWGVQIGGGAGTNTHGVAVKSDKDGNVCVVGHTDGPSGGVAPELGTAGGQDGFVYKFGPDGATAWGKELGGGGGTVTSAEGVSTDAADNVFVSGYVQGAVSGVFGSEIGTAGASDMVALKFDLNGNLQWGRQIGAGAGTSTFGTAAATDSGGNLLITGWTNGAFGTQLGTAGSTDYVVVKLDTNGNKLWSVQKGAGAGIDVNAYGIAIDSGDNVIISGYTDAGAAGLGTQLSPYGFGGSAFVSKISSAGAHIWTVQKDAGAGAVSTYGAACDSAGNIYVGGYNAALGTMGTQIGVKGSDDAYIMKLSSAGAYLWAREIGTNNAVDMTVGYGVAVDVNNNAHLGGWTTGVLGTLNGIHGGHDGFTLKFDTNGNQVK